MRSVKWIVIRNQAGDTHHYEAHGLLHGYHGRVVRITGVNWFWALVSQAGAMVRDGREPSMMLARLAMEGAAREFELVPR
jgi:hypothetical protein